MFQRVMSSAILLGLFAAFGLSASALSQQPLVDKFVLSDTIQPVTQGELDRAIVHAAAGLSPQPWSVDVPGS